MFIYLCALIIHTQRTLWRRFGAEDLPISSTHLQRAISLKDFEEFLSEQISVLHCFVVGKKS